MADIGYTSVQVSGTCPYESEWLKEQLDKTGLTRNLTHTPFAAMIENPIKVVENHRIFNCKYIDVGSMPGILEADHNKSTWVDFTDKALPAVKAFN